MTQPPPKIITADEVCAMLHIKRRTLERRHGWKPQFPAPLTRRPLTWLQSGIEAWILAADEQQQQRRAA
jgi:predicted DNA-binding transcriptional regulator AlpA